MPETERKTLLAPLVEQWTQKLLAAKQAKKPFDDIAQQCDGFFAKASGFMWKDAFKNAYIGTGVRKPKFETTLQKAFELVAVFGPYLFWRYPSVRIKNPEPVELSPELFERFGEAAEDVFQQAMQDRERERSRGRTRNSLMEEYLKYSQREQPGGGLAVHGELAITEALVKGRGCLWIEDYEFPGSGRTLTGRFFDTVDNLLIDPDSMDPTLTDAQFIVRRHCTPSWKLERKFDLKPGSLMGRGQWESYDSQASNQGDLAGLYRRHKGTNDLVTWFEIWSKAGVATRASVENEPNQLAGALHDHFDRVVGDYAYLCIVPGLPWPLNLPEESIHTLGDEGVRERLRWRAPNYGSHFPTYTDSRWPVAVLDFYRHYGSAWPIAPLAPALGELVVMNILISAYTEQAYDNRKLIIAYLESAAKNVEEAINGDASPALVKINDSAHNKITEMIQYLQRPTMNKEILEALEMMSASFDKRTGLSEILYAMNVGGKQSRTAKDVSVKEEKASIRPDKMAKDVAAWMTEAADLEKFLAGWVVEGKDLVELLGRWGAYFWDELIVAEDPEVVVREMRATVEASDIRKPNKERLVENMQQMMDRMLPLLQAYAQDTGDTEPINSFIDKLGEAMEQDMSPWHLGEWQEQVPEEVQKQQQVMAQLEQAKQQAEVLKTQVETQKTQIELEKERVAAAREAIEGGTDAAKRRFELLMDAQKHRQELGQDQQRHVQEMVQDRGKHLLELMQRREEGQQKLAQMRAENHIKANGQKTNGKAA